MFLSNIQSGYVTITFQKYERTVDEIPNNKKNITNLIITQGLVKSHELIKRLKVLGTSSEI